CVIVSFSLPPSFSLSLSCHIFFFVLPSPSSLPPKCIFSHTSLPLPRANLSLPLSARLSALCCLLRLVSTFAFIVMHPFTGTHTHTHTCTHTNTHTDKHTQTNT